MKRGMPLGCCAPPAATRPCRSEARRTPAVSIDRIAFGPRQPGPNYDFTTCRPFPFIVLAVVLLDTLFDGKFVCHQFQAGTLDPRRRTLAASRPRSRRAPRLFGHLLQ